MLRVLHVFRSPVGGLFRHVADLAREQARMGLAVGLVFDDAPAWGRFETVWPELQQICTAGCLRLPIPRLPGPRDVANIFRLSALFKAQGFDIVHGHGAKGGVYARLLGRLHGVPSIYTLHGGVLHFSRKSAQGILYRLIERRLLPMSGGLIFDSHFARDEFAAEISGGAISTRVIPNAVDECEFAPLAMVDDPFDFVFLGELRQLKGLDVLLNAAALMRDKGRKFRIGIFGAGPDEAAFRAQAAQLRLDTPTVEWRGPVRNGREAFSAGRCLVFTSRRESCPYVVLEAGAARIPLISTDVGAVPEIVRPEDRPTLLKAGDTGRLADAMSAFLDDPSGFRTRAQAQSARVRAMFGVDAMAERTLGFYRDVIAAANVRRD